MSENDAQMSDHSRLQEPMFTLSTHQDTIHGFQLQLDMTTGCPHTNEHIPGYWTALEGKLTERE